MATLPLPSRRPARSTRARGSQVPTRQDVPQVGIPNDPGVAATPGAFGEIEAGAIESVGTALSAAAERVQRQKDQIELDRSFGTFMREAGDEFMSIQTGEDMTKEETLLKFNQSLSNKRAQFLESFAGSGDARVKLSSKLENASFKFIDDASIISTTQRNQMVADQLQLDINTRVADLQSDPTQLPAVLEDIGAMMDERIDVLTGPQEKSFMKAAVTQAHEAALNTYFIQGNIDSAKDLLNNPVFVSRLGMDKATNFRDRIVQFEQKMIQADQKQREGKKQSLMDKVLELDGALKALGQDGVKKEHIEKLAGAEIDPTKVPEMEKYLDAVNIAVKAGVPLKNQDVLLGAMETAGIPIKGELEGRLTAKAKIEESRLLGDAGLLNVGKETDLVKDGAVTVKASNSLRNGVAGLFGGTVGPNGEILGLTKEQREVGLAIETEASDLMVRGEVDSIAKAITVASSGKNLPQVPTFAEAADEAIAQVDNRLSGKELKKLADGYDKIDLTNATGAASAGAAVWNNVIGQPFSGATFDDIEEARMKLKVLANDWLIMSRRSAGRVAVFEQQELQKIFGGPNALRSAKAVQVGMAEMDRMLSDAISEQRTLLNIRNIPVERQREALMDIMNMTSFQNKLRQFDLTPGNVEINTIADVQNLDDNKFEEYMRAQDPKSLSQLPDDVFKAVMERDSGQEVTPSQTPLADADQTNLAPGSAAAPAPVELTPRVREALGKYDDKFLRGLIQRAQEKGDPKLGLLQAEFEARKKNKKKNKKKK